LRNFDRDFEFLASLQPHLPPPVFNVLNNRAVFSNASKANQDAGLSHKQAEMSMVERVADQPGFFGPGYISPFNPHVPDHTIFLIRMFGFCMPLFFNGQRRVILDSGCGYSWTTEWMLRMGFEPIGVEISRVYLDIANTRVGDLLPYVLVGDAEKLPIRDSVLDGVLGFDAFHHIANRKGAMREFYRTMKPGAVIVLAEPGSAHEHVPSVKEIMKKLGTLEIGMELSDVQEYVRGSGLKPPLQHHILRVPHSDVNGKLSPKFLQQYSFNPANLFTIEK